MDESDFEDSSEALNPSDQQQPSTNNNMNESNLKCWLETLNLSDQQQPSSQYLSANNRMNELVRGEEEKKYMTMKMNISNLGIGQ